MLGHDFGVVLDLGFGVVWDQVLAWFGIGFRCGLESGLSVVLGSGLGQHFELFWSAVL